MDVKALLINHNALIIYSPINSASFGIKPRIARVPSAKLRSSVSMDFSSLQGIKEYLLTTVLLFLLSNNVLNSVWCVFEGLSQRNELSSDGGVVGHSLTYTNGTIKTEEENSTREPSPPLVKPTLRESVRGLKGAKGTAVLNTSASFGVTTVKTGL